MDSLPRPVIISIYALADFLLNVHRDMFFNGRNDIVSIDFLGSLAINSHHEELLEGVNLFSLDDSSSPFFSNNFYDICRELIRIYESGFFKTVESKYNNDNDDHIEFIFDDRLRDDYFFLETLIKDSVLCDYDGHIIGSGCTVSIYLHGQITGNAIVRFTGSVFTIDDVKINECDLKEILDCETPLIRRQKIALDHLKLKPKPVLLKGKAI
jgi:hypothetical protein